MNLLPGEAPQPNFLQRAFKSAKHLVFPWMAMPDATRDNNSDMIANQQFLQERQFEFSVAQMKWQHTQEIARQAWQEGEADKQRGFLSQESATQRHFQHEENQILQRFQAYQADIQRQWQEGEADKQRLWQENQNKLQLAFQEWALHFTEECQERQLKSRQEYEQYVLEQRHQWEMEAQQRGYEFQFFLEQFRVQATRDRDQFNLVLRDQPWKTQPLPILAEYEGFHKVNQAIPPLVVVSPAAFGFQCPVSQPQPPNVTQGIEQNLTRFLEEHYPKESPAAPARPVAQLWNGVGKVGDPAVIDLHYLFRSVPSIILESQLNAGKLSLDLFFWDVGQQPYSKINILWDFDCKGFLDTLERQKALEWYHQKLRLEQSGLDISRAMPPGSQNAVFEHNLQQLIQERQYQAAGIHDLPGQYLPTPAGITLLMEYLSVLHCLTAGLFIDSYHLMRSRVHPQMPCLVGQLAQRLPEDETQGMVDIILQYAEDLAAQQEQLGDLNIPELLLEFALGFEALQNPTALARLMNAGVNLWLKRRDLPIDPNPAQQVATIAAALRVEDQGFVAKLNQCWERLQQDQRLDVGMACYNRGLERLGAADYRGAIGDFDQVLYLNDQDPHGYFQRGLAYLGLAEAAAYGQALGDFNQVLLLQRDYPEAYRWRGEAHYLLGNHPAALADLRSAATAGVTEAETRWQIVQGVWADLQRREAEEVERQEAYNQGVHYTQQGDYDRAIAAFQKAEQLGHRKARQQREAVEQQKAEAERRQQLSFALPGEGGTLEFVWVPSGELIMVDEHRGSLWDWEVPHEVPSGELIMVDEHHRVQVPEFRIGKFPVTQRQYQAIMKTNPSFFQADDLTPEEQKKGLTHWDRPVEIVTWHQAVEFCEKLTNILKIEGYEVRLPSETMWEWAARDGENSSLTYAGSNDLNEVGWYDDNAGGKTHPVGQKNPTKKLGIHDMSGNVWEWCWDRWSSDSNVLPKKGKPLLEGGDNTKRAVRGGSWFISADICSSGNRYYYNPGNCGIIRGFRVVLLPVGFVP
ncbi:SUMF1/EgtB/PvdO family nonheme iron enzyme [Prochlorothrix hollandica]|uniref:SUMF1/EgtB/PvdO family nonheme iron enzyme n=1 Tax=Prochlorothrix hollandica TaxID=1223 RepID=UPI0003765DA3|nr:SUMF1/EgtB/PvdO family nonheme iron enzyme [Prochlorothrix hollandica]